MSKRREKGKTSDQSRFTGLKLLTSSAVFMCAAALLFNGLIQTAAAAELGRKDVIPTSYSVPPVTKVQNTVPDGYVKANYMVVQDFLEYFKDKQPTGKDLQMNDAAEKGAQMLWELFGLNAENATFYMGYDPGTQMFPRAFWAGDVRKGSSRKPGDTGYTFTIDAVTGEWFGCAYSRKLSVKADLGYDKALEANPQQYLDLARALVEQHGLLDSGISKIVYESQGYNNNDPDLSVYVHGTKGEKILISFSRYDQCLKGISFDSANRITEQAISSLN